MIVFENIITLTGSYEEGEWTVTQVQTIEDGKPCITMKMVPKGESTHWGPIPRRIKNLTFAVANKHAIPYPLMEKYISEIRMHDLLVVVAVRFFICNHGASINPLRIPFDSNLRLYVFSTGSVTKRSSKSSSSSSHSSHHSSHSSKSSSIAGKSFVSLSLPW